MGVRSRVVVEGGLAVPQKYSSNVWGYADTMLSVSILAEAVVSLSVVDDQARRIGGTEDDNSKT